MQQMDMGGVIQNNLLGEERKRLQGEAFVKSKYCLTILLRVKVVVLTCKHK
jgi:hypothetical protein